MPLYEYRCHACGKKFEVLQKFSDEPLKTHPECGGEVEKLMSAPAFHLKGTGWYATDYAKKGDSGSDHKMDSKPAADASNGSSTVSEASTGSSSGDSSGSESKPAASETKSLPSPAPAAGNDK